MATLKEHQAAMVDLLANGSGIPASASRLAHAMHDVLQVLDVELAAYHKRVVTADIAVQAHAGRIDATTPGLNDKALSKREKALKTDSPAKWPTPAEQRVKEMENTIRQLKANNAKLKDEREYFRLEYEALYMANNYLTEQAGCRKEDTQVCEHAFKDDGHVFACKKCGVHPSDVGPTSNTVPLPPCGHSWVLASDEKHLVCIKCESTKDYK